MRRLISTISCDIRVQFRNGFYYAALFVAVFWTLLLSRVPPNRLTHWMPVLILSNLLINTFYFMAGLVLLEKTEGTLIAQRVTPLRVGEYLISKVITLSLVSVCEAWIIVLFGYGTGFGPMILLAGVASAAIVFSFAGFLIVIRYDSINEFLIPSFLFMLLFVPPFLSYFGLFETSLMYVHPIQAPLLLTQAAFEKIEFWQSAYSVFATCLWIGVAFSFSRRSFERFVIAPEGE